MGDPMSDPIKNCLLEVCCEPAAARASFAGAMMADGVCTDRAEADAVAQWVYRHFDLAPAGTLRAFKAAIAKVARA